jgi:hypothetical protein
MNQLAFSHRLRNKLGVTHYLPVLGILCSFSTHAQQLVPDERVHTAAIKVPALGDPAFKKTTTYAKQQTKHPKTFAETAQKDIKYPDGSVVHLKMVKNPSFGGQGTSIKADTEKGSGKKESKTENGKQWDCATSSIKLTANSTSFLNADYATQAGYIYPGAIYTFDNFYNGSYKEQVGKRYPITLVNENPNIQGSAYVVVSDPGIAKVTNGVNKLINEMRGPAANEEFKYQVYETGNSAAQSLQISGGGSFAGFSASNKYGTSSVSNSVSLTIDATKIVYTINTAPEENGFFVDANIEKIPNLMVIGRVSYGIRVLANLTYTMNSSKEADEFKAGYSGFGGSANVTLGQMSKNASVSDTINGYVVGGPGNVTMSFDKRDLEEQLKAVFKGATYQNAKPIEYSFFDMSGDLVGSNSATDQFTQRNCVPNDNAAKLESAYITYQSGARGKDYEDHYNVSLYGGKSPTRNNYNGYDNYPQTQDNGEAFIAAYKTGPLNVAFGSNSSHQDQLTENRFFTNVTMDYFVKNGGLIHLHIYPNGNDTWNIGSIKLQLNFVGGISQIVNFGAVTLSQDSTEATLYFDGAFKQRGGN